MAPDRLLLLDARSLPQVSTYYAGLFPGFGTVQAV